MDKQHNKWLRIMLPSGRALMYMHPTLKDDKYGTLVTYRGVNPTTYQWVDKKLTPGLITENVVQALARDILCNGMLNVRDKMPEAPLIMCIHDEAGSLIKEDDIDDNTLEKFNQLLCKPEPWMTGIPLAAEGYIAKRYKKG